MPLVRESYEPTDRGEDLVDNPVGGVRIVLCNMAPDVVAIGEGFRVRCVAAQALLFR